MGAIEIIDNMERCDTCHKIVDSDKLKKIEVDWDHTYKMVCPDCIKERGAYMIACRIDRSLSLQDAEYKETKNAHSQYAVQ